MSKPYQPSAIARAFYNFKSWNLPWRRKFFRGFDLDGNKFYEQYNPLTPNKLRRTVKYIKDGHYTDNNVTRLCLDRSSASTKKIHSEFSRQQGVANILQADLDAAVATALKLTADTDYLLQLLLDVAAPRVKDTQPLAEQLVREDLKDDETLLDDAGSELADDYYTLDEIPPHFNSLPWDLDLNSFSGSHLDDLDNAAKTAANGLALLNAETKATPLATSAKKQRTTTTGSKKRERVEMEEDQNTPSAARKKKRKSLLSQEVGEW
ncbi:hypothetical protein MRB53_039776 [Persea americana]|nr:hypothetical protein MRB53_039776 [Persea americana]